MRRRSLAPPPSDALREPHDLKLVRHHSPTRRAEPVVARKAGRDEYHGGRKRPHSRRGRDRDRAAAPDRQAYVGGDGTSDAYRFPSHPSAESLSP